MKFSSARFFTIAFLSVILLAAPGAIAGGTTAQQQIAKLGLLSNGLLRITGTKAWTNKDKCQNTAYAVLRPSHNHFDRLYAMLLVAHAQGIETALVVNGCVKVAGKTRPVVTGVYMHRPVWAAFFKCKNHVRIPRMAGPGLVTAGMVGSIRARIRRTRDDSTSSGVGPGPG